MGDVRCVESSQRRWKREGSGEEKNRTQAELLREQTGIWRSADPLMGKQSFWEVRGAAGRRDGLTRRAATGTPRGAWSRGQRGRIRPSRWCSGG